jgi:hypothetical protein
MRLSKNREQTKNSDWQKRLLGNTTSLEKNLQLARVSEEVTGLAIASKSNLDACIVRQKFLILFFFTLALMFDVLVVNQSNSRELNNHFSPENIQQKAGN